MCKPTPTSDKLFSSHSTQTPLLHPVKHSSVRFVFVGAHRVKSACGNAPPMRTARVRRRNVSATALVACLALSQVSEQRWENFLISTLWVYTPFILVFSRDKKYYEYISNFVSYYSWYTIKYVHFHWLRSCIKHKRINYLLRRIEGCRWVQNILHRCRVCPDRVFAGKSYNSTGCAFTFNFFPSGFHFAGPIPNEFTASNVCLSGKFLFARSKRTRRSAVEAKERKWKKQQHARAPEKVISISFERSRRMRVSLLCLCSGDTKNQLVNTINFY